MKRTTDRAAKVYTKMARRPKGTDLAPVRVAHAEIVAWAFIGVDILWATATIFQINESAPHFRKKLKRLSVHYRTALRQSEVLGHRVAALRSARIRIDEEQCERRRWLALLT
jgi:hypothetical protein